MRSSIDNSFAAFTNDEFLSQRKRVINENSGDLEKQWSECLQLYYSSCKDTLLMFAALGWYGNSNQARFFQNAIKRWIEMPSTEEKHVIWRYIPTVLLLYVCSISAVYKQNWHFITSTILSLTSSDPLSNKNVPILHLLGARFYLAAQYQFSIGSKTNLGSFIAPVLAPLFVEHEFSYSDEEFNKSFDLFEMFLSFCYLATPSSSVKMQDWMLNHRAIYKPSVWSYISEFWHERGVEGANWTLVQTDLIKSTTTVENVLVSYDTIHSKFVQNLLFFEKTNYLNSYKGGLQTGL